MAEAGDDGRNGAQLSGVLSRSGVDVPLLSRLRTGIVEGLYPPETLLSEVSLADEYQVSRTPIREALKQLQIEGLVEIRPRVGTFVRRPSRREIAELFELKESLEGLAAALMARRGRVSELDALERNLEQTERAVRRHDEHTHAELVKQFHEILVEGADNTKLSEHYDRLMNQLAYAYLVRKTLSQKGRPSLSMAEHSEVVRLIMEKDPVGAELAMRNHVVASARLALREISREEEPG